MDIYEVCKKLIGEVNPIGSTEADDIRFENLKKMIELTDKLLSDIDHVAWFNRKSCEFSKKRASDLANKFLDRIGTE